MHAQWSDAYAALSAADADGALDAAGLEQLAVAAYMTGRDDDCRNALTRAHQMWVSEGDVDRAVRCAFWIGLNLQLAGQLAPAHGWFIRGEQLVADREETVGAGYLAVAGAYQALVTGDAPRALREFEKPRRLGRHGGDVDLATFGHLGCGQALVALGRPAEGLAALDEAMVAVTTGEVSPILAGIVYCAVIEACQELCDLRRAQEWTDALSEWCDRQAGLVPYRGQCMVHRAELLRTQGSWAAALAEAEQAAACLSEPLHPAVGAAVYVQAELHRLRGDAENAERCYRQASEFGHGVQPGLALLRLAQGRVDDAGAAVRRALLEPQPPSVRASLLAAHAEIALAADDVAGARAAADELTALARELGAPQLLDGISRQVEGAVLLAEGDPAAALRSLRQAWMVWHELDAPYEAARTRMQIALACRGLGDEESALLELDAARRVFAELGAEVDGARTERLVARQPSGTLSPRELEVLALVATGATNRSIAGELVISEKTVARHLSNIFTKLGVASRAAATAYAYEHDLVGGTRRN